MKLQNSENFFVLGAFLAALCLICALLLALVAGLARKPIEEAERRTMNQALAQVLPPFDNQPAQDSVEIDGITFMRAYRDGKLVALAAVGERKGYAGPIRALVGLDPDGKIRSILITKQNETPGLGANVCERKHRKTVFNLFKESPTGLAPNPFLDQFDGKTATAGTDWKLRKDGGDVEYVTGATITCRAITGLADEIARTYLANRETVIAGSPAGGK